MKCQRGVSPSVEAAIIIPGIFLLLGLLVVVARIVTATHSLESAAFAAARAASMERQSQAAVRVGTQAFLDDLAARKITCQSHQIQLDVTQLAAVEGATAEARVNVTCTVNLADVALPGMQGTYTVKAAASSPIDTYRQR